MAVYVIKMTAILGRQREIYALTGSGGGATLQGGWGGEVDSSGAVATEGGGGGVTKVLS
jgi:hypothetical protein